MNAPQRAVFQNVEARLHVDAEQCPMCEQPIPREKYAEVRGRIAARDRELSDQLKEQFVSEKAELNALAKADLERARQDGATALEKANGEIAAKEAAALAEGKKAAEKAMQPQLLAANQAKDAALAEAERAKSQAVEANSAAQVQMEQVRKNAAIEIDKLKQDYAAKEAAAREDGKRVAEAAMQTRLAEAVNAKAAAETAMRQSAAEVNLAKRNAEQAAAAAKTEAEGLRVAHAAVVAKLQSETAAKENAAREAGKKAAEAAMQPQLVAAEQQIRGLKESHDAVMNQRLQEQREALEKDMEQKVKVEQSKAFEEKQKFETTVQQLQRQLQNKTAQELGEGAEIDLFEELKNELKEDRVVRVGKGAPGADIIHTVCHNGKECGRIIYDSKNRNQWRHEFATKLRADQISAKADHAILSSHVFPQGTKQLHQQEGVIICQPARVLVLAQLLRQHLVQLHTLRTSNEARSQKTEALYEFITSDGFTSLLGQIDSYTEKLLKMEVDEQKAHEKMWAAKGRLYRDIQKANGNLNFEIERIIGTAEATE